MQKTDIRSLLPQELEAFLAEYGEPKYRAKQIFSRLAAGDAISEMTNLSKSLRERLASDCEDRSLKVEKKLVSAKDGTIKYLFGLCDGECISTETRSAFPVRSVAVWDAAFAPLPLAEG